MSDSYRQLFVRRPVRYATSAELREHGVRGLAGRGLLLPPMAGGDGDGGDGGDGGGDAGGASGDAGEGGDADDADGDGDGDDEGDHEPDADADEGDDDEVRTQLAELKAQNRRLQAEAEQAAKRARKAERAIASRRERERTDAGEFEALYNEQKAENERLRASIVQEKLDGAIVDEATKLRFVNPSVAVRLVQLDEETTHEDRREIQKALNDLLKQEPYLAKRRQRADAGDGDSTTENGDGGRRRRREAEAIDESPEALMASAYAGTSS